MKTSYFLSLLACSRVRDMNARPQVWKDLRLRRCSHSPKLFRMSCAHSYHAVLSRKRLSASEDTIDKKRAPCKRTEQAFPNRNETVRKVRFNQSTLHFQCGRGDGFGERGGGGGLNVTVGTQRVCHFLVISYPVLFKTCHKTGDCYKHDQ